MRWTFGETRARPTSPQAISLLEMSVKFAEHLFPEASLVICQNNLSPALERKTQAIAETFGVELIDVTGRLQHRLRTVDAKNSWWKYALPRFDSDRYEVILDNDVILWKEPQALLEAIRTNALLALTDAAGRFYGDFDEEVGNLDPDLKLNAGLIGMPTGFSPDFGLLRRVVMKDFFHSEQGFTALGFALQEGPKHLVPLSEVQQINVNRVPPEELVSGYSGGHFCGCSYGHYSFWEEEYAPVVESKYLEVSSDEDSDV